MSSFYIGIDLGGTNLKAGVTNNNGQLLAHITVPTGDTPKERAPDNVIARMIAAAEQAITLAKVNRRQIVAAGVAAPGQAFLDKGILHRAANLPLWKDVPLRARISRGLKLPAVLENDANAAAFGEYWAGAGKNRNLETLFMITLGTGIGGGLVYRGAVVRGACDFAAEIGHTIVVPGGNACGCGQHGCLETYCSAGYIGRKATEMLRGSPKLRRTSSLGKVLAANGEISAADIDHHARAGDQLAVEIWEDACRYIAIACINVTHVIDPEMIVLGGGMAASGKFLLTAVQKHIRKLWWKMSPQKATIAIARLGNDSGCIGAAGVARFAADRGELLPLGR